jgi:hypothetical protein
VIGRRALGLAAALLALAPAAALACPSCALRSGPGASTFALIAGMIAAPLVVAAVTVAVVRRLDRR